MPPLAACLALVAGHAVCGRLWPAWNIVLSYVGVACVGGLGLVGYVSVVSADVESVAAALVLYVAAAEVYLFLITLARSSVSAQILLVLLTGSQEMARLRAVPVHARDDMVRPRLGRLVDLGLVEPQGGTLRTTSRGAVLVSGYRLLRRIFGHVPADGPLP